jgi:hypothetical protein
MVRWQARGRSPAGGREEVLNRFGWHNYFDAAISSENAGSVRGKPYTDGMDACVNALGGLGEREDFIERRSVMEQFETADNNAWLYIRKYRQYMSNLSTDPTRKDNGIGKRFLNEIKTHLKQAEDAENYLGGIYKRCECTQYRSGEGLIAGTKCLIGALLP